MKKIGGEFEINPRLLKIQDVTLLENEFLVGSGREAFFDILYFLKNKFNIKNLLLPDYLCESIYLTAKKLEIQIIYFHINDNLAIDKYKFPYSSNNAILVINYFGLCDVNIDIDWLKENFNDCFVILDNVQAFYEMDKPTNADFSFTSLRKTFPVPDGGWIKINNYFDISSYLIKKNKNNIENIKLLA